MSADPIELVKAARRGLGRNHLIVAGSVSTAAQIAALKEAGADAFTIGSAVFDGSYARDKGSIQSQLAAIAADCAAASAQARQPKEGAYAGPGES
jgi:pentose-5-phosphate-3-epimerase